MNNGNSDSSYFIYLFVDIVNRGKILLMIKDRLERDFLIEIMLPFEEDLW